MPSVRPQVLADGGDGLVELLEQVGMCFDHPGELRVLLVGRKLAFVNATRSFLAGTHEVPFAPCQAAIEVLEFAIALTRARMAEAMASALSPALAEHAFAVGLVSALDLLLQVPLSGIVEGMSLAAELEDALLLHQGVLGAVLTDVLAWELGGEALPEACGLGPAEVEKCYLQALARTNEVCGVLDLTERPGLG